MNNSGNVEMINGIRLDYTNYTGDDLYSDGDIEDTILEACKTKTADYLLRHSTDYAVFYHLSELRHNLVEWIPFSGDEEVLEVGSGCGAITGVFAEKAKNVTCIELSKRRSLINAYRNMDYSNIEIKIGNFQTIERELGQFDVISLIGVLEYSPLYIDTKDNPFTELLYMLRNHLKQDGRILVAIENKMGIKYFNGAWEDHTMKQFEGLNDYTSIDSVRTFSKQELINLFEEAGFNKMEFHYPSPDYKIPDVIYSDKYMPKPSEIRTFGKNYQGPQFYNFNDMVVNDQICSDGVFDYFSNSFFVVLGGESNTLYTKYSRERLPQFRIGTSIRENRKREVIKYALSKSAINHISDIKRNEQELIREMKRLNSKVLCSKGELLNGEYVSEFIEGATLEQDFYLVRNSVANFTNLAKKYIDEYYTFPIECMKKFEKTDEFVRVFGDYPFETFSMSITNIDPIFSNMIRTKEGNIYLIDYEWVFSFPVPYDYPIWRALSVLYFHFSAYLSKKIQFKDFIKQFGFDDGKIDAFLMMDNCFSFFVCGKSNSEIVSKKYEKESIMQIIRRY